MKNLSFKEFQFALSDGVLWKTVNDYVQFQYCLLDDGTVRFDVLTSINSELVCSSHGGFYPDLKTAYVSWCGFDGNLVIF